MEGGVFHMKGIDWTVVNRQDTGELRCGQLTKQTTTLIEMTSGGRQIKQLPQDNTVWYTELLNDVYLPADTLVDVGMFCGLLYV